METIEPTKSVDRFDFKTFEEWVSSRDGLRLDDIGITTDIARGYRERGLSAVKADILAIRVGQHPGNIWPEWWEVPWMEDEEYAKTGQVFVKQKACNSCKKEKHRSKFGRRASAKDGLTGDCKTCIKDKMQERKEPVNG